MEWEDHSLGGQKELTIKKYKRKIQPATENTL